MSAVPSTNAAVAINIIAPPEDITTMKPSPDATEPETPIEYVSCFEECIQKPIDEYFESRSDRKSAAMVFRLGVLMMAPIFYYWVLWDQVALFMTTLLLLITHSMIMAMIKRAGPGVASLEQAPIIVMAFGMAIAVLMYCGRSLFFAVAQPARIGPLYAEDRHLLIKWSLFCSYEVSEVGLAIRHRCNNEEIPVFQMIVALVTVYYAYKTFSLSIVRYRDNIVSKSQPKSDNEEIKSGK